MNILMRHEKILYNIDGTLTGWCVVSCRLLTKHTHKKKHIKTKETKTQKNDNNNKYKIIKKRKTKKSQNDATCT